ncbi:PREDICTED: defensin-like protein 266 [Camelina sativa]|uniref:Defensin-like protein 266 n=1 Tax=Camelina sativa TaxID=90675 RepID=A0ABM1R3Z3_CAMSA|nr:PREDICTED: defensin-like protein 266 [Camelina sativa]
MEKTVFMKVVFFAFLLSLSCLMEGEARVSGKMKDVTIQRGGSCASDNTCHDTCSGCKNTQCIFSQCVCTQCNTPRTSVRTESHM